MILRKKVLLKEAGFDAEDKATSEILDKYLRLKNPPNPASWDLDWVAKATLQEWLDADWDLKIIWANKLLEKLVTECGETDFERQARRSNPGGAIYEKYLYNAPFKDSAKVKKLCDRYSAKYPGLDFYCVDYTEHAPGEINYHLWEASVDKENAYLNP